MRYIKIMRTGRPPMFPRVSEHEKTCTVCKKVKPLSDFGRASRPKDGRKSWCTPCDSAKALRYRKSAIGRRNQRNAHMKHEHGISLAEKEGILKKQGGVCAVCQTEGWNSKGPQLDHCHVTGKIRGVLCTYCNTMLGLARDSIETLLSAIRYLRDNGDPG